MKLRPPGYEPDEVPFLGPLFSQNDLNKNWGKLRSALHLNEVVMFSGERFKHILKNFSAETCKTAMRIQARTFDGIIDGIGEAPLENVQLFQC